MNLSKSRAVDRPIHEPNPHGTWTLSTTTITTFEFYLVCLDND
jgi:hypothetical protein